MSISNLSNYDVKLDTCGLACPLPLLKTKQALYQIKGGEILLVVSEQASLSLDIKTLLKKTQDILLQECLEDGLYSFLIQKRPLTTPNQ